MPPAASAYEYNRYVTPTVLLAWLRVHVLVCVEVLSVRVQTEPMSLA